MARTSNKRQEILAFVKNYFKENGYAPSVRDIKDGVGLSSTASVHYHLKALAETGELSIDGSKNRAIRRPDQAGIPIIGVVTAGYPILAVEHIEGYLKIQADDDSFALRVRGDSMIEAGIYDGDKVIVRPQEFANHGEIVVALIGDEATVKRLHLQSGEVWLKPENPNYNPINGKTAKILGVVKAIYREY